MASAYSLFQSLSQYTSGHVLLMVYSAEQHAFAAGDIAANAIALPAATFVARTRVRITGLSAFNSNQIYWCLNNTSPYQFSVTMDGPAIAIPTAAAGTITDTEPVETGQSGLAYQVQSVADAARYEVGSYQGLINRPAITHGAAAIANDQVAIESEINLDNSGGAATLSYGYSVLTKSGSATPGNTTGEVQQAFKYASLQNAVAGANPKLTFTITSERDG